MRLSPENEVSLCLVCHQLVTENEAVLHFVECDEVVCNVCWKFLSESERQAYLKEDANNLRSS